MMNQPTKTQTGMHGSGASRRGFFAVLAVGLLALIVTLAGCSGGGAPGPAATQPTFGLEKGSSKLQVGFVTVGPTSDWGFNYQHNQGRLGMEARMRDKVHTVIAENVPENADVERVMQRMCDEGANLIYATSYGYLDSVLRIAEKNPNVKFMHCLGTKRSANVGTYSANLWEPAYVAGVVAAMTTKDTKFGFVTSHPIPPIFWIMNAFALGAQSVNKNITIDSVFTSSWYNPAAETEAVNSLAAKGVKAVYILVDSPIAGVQAAERNNLYSVAQHADLSTFAPKGWITGSVWGWTKLYVDVTESVLNKTWTNQNVAGGFKEGYVSLAPFGPAVPAAAHQKARDLVGKIASGQLQVFAGPITDSAGTIRVPAGKTLSVDEVLTMGWVVRGVNGVPSK